MYMFKYGLLIESVEQLRILEFLAENFNPEKFEIEFPNSYTVKLKDESGNKVTIRHECGNFKFDYDIDEMPF